MASSAGHDFVKAGYWFFGSDLKRQVKDIPSELFTHLYAGFAKVNDDGRVSPDPYQELFQSFTTTVRRRNPSVKTLLSIGGEGADLSAVVASSDKRKNLITDSIDLARRFGFDGLDLCWLYPSKSNQEFPFRDLLIQWRSDLDEEVKKTKRPKSETLLLTAAVFHHSFIPGRDHSNTFNYPIQAVYEKLDWINVLAIDFYTPSISPKETGPVHAWDTRPMDQQNRCARVGIDNWINRGVESNKFVFGLPFYGYEWNLNEKNPNSISGFFAPATGANRLPLAYRDIQEELRKGIYKTVYDRKYEAVYSNKNNGEKWIGYDDACSISGKVSKAIEAKLGGYFAWHLGADDFNWSLSRSAFESSHDQPAEADDPY